MALTVGLGGVVAVALHSRPALSAALGRFRAPTLWPADAEVWATSVAVEGTPTGVRLTVDGEPVATAVAADGFSARIPLQAGPNEADVSELSARATLRRVYTARLPTGPTARATVGVEDGIVTLDASSSEPDCYTGAPIEFVTWRERDGQSLGVGNTLTLGGPWQGGERYIAAAVTDAAGATDETTVVFEVSGGQPGTVDPATWQPGWVREAIVYGVIPPLFGEPPLEAVSSQLPRLQALGVDTLWLSPVFSTVAGDFGYAVTDYFSVRPDYGDLASLRALVVAAHERGMKVILDLPLNDTSIEHPYFLQAKEDTTGSHYWDFYERDSRGNAKHYFNWSKLPNLSYDEPAVRRMAIEIAAHWLAEADVDGFRVDAAWGVEERQPGYWLQWRAELQRIRPDLMLIAEGSARETIWSTAGFSAAYDWTNRLGDWSWSEAFKHSRPARPLAAALAAATGSVPLRFLDNNDTGRRFTDAHGPAMTRAAAAMLLTLPGLPSIYTGQEIGASYLPYRQAGALDWSSDPDGLEDEYRRLIAARRAGPALLNAELTVLNASNRNVLAYTVRTPQSEMLTAINFSDGPSQTTIALEEGGTLSCTIQGWSSLSKPTGAESPDSSTRLATTAATAG